MGIADTALLGVHAHRRGCPAVKHDPIPQRLWQLQVHGCPRAALTRLHPAGGRTYTVTEALDSHTRGGSTRPRASWPLAHASLSMSRCSTSEPSGAAASRKWVAPRPARTARGSQPPEFENDQRPRRCSVTDASDAPCPLANNSRLRSRARTYQRRWDSAPSTRSSRTTGRSSQAAGPRRRSSQRLAAVPPGRRSPTGRRTGQLRRARAVCRHGAQLLGRRRHRLGTVRASLTGPQPAAASTAATHSVRPALGALAT